PPPFQQRYIEGVLHDLEAFKRHTPATWPYLETTVGRNDGTWKIICAHFIRHAGTTNAKVHVNTWVPLKDRYLKQYEVTELAFIEYTGSSYKGSRLPWRARVSCDMAHICTKTDERTGQRWIKLRLRPRHRETPDDILPGRRRN
ncbi:hypothetical protein PhCBS80983_g01992, partial [Powellomyces hirtus]